MLKLNLYGAASSDWSGSVLCLLPLAAVSEFKVDCEYSVQHTLKKLKEMLDLGLIEKAEYDAKKAEVMSRM